jgi:hypothetical protein
LAIPAVTLAAGVNNTAAYGARGRVDVQDIQRAANTGYTQQTFYFDSGSVIHITSSGGGYHAVAANITGVRITISGGNLTGRMTVWGN